MKTGRSALGLALAVAALAATTPPPGDRGVLMPTSGERPRRRSVVVGEGSPPDELSSDRSHPAYDPCYSRVDVYLDGVKRPYDVRYYSVTEGIVETVSGRLLRGRVEPRWRPAPSPPLPPPPRDDEGALARAEARRARRAEKAARDAERSRR